MKRFMSIFEDLLLMHPAMEIHHVSEHLAQRAMEVNRDDDIAAFAFIFCHGQNKVRGMKFQRFSVPSGLIASLYGPYEGRNLDISMFVDSGIEDWLHKHANRLDGSH